MNTLNPKFLNYLHTLKAIGFSYHDPIILQKPKQISTSVTSLEPLHELVKECSLCELSKVRKNVVFGFGNPKSKLLFVSDVPSILEDEEGRAFVGKSGELLEKIVQNVLNAELNDFYYTNIIKCKTPNNRAAHGSELMLCRDFLDQQIEIIKPKLIVALGSASFKALSGINDNIEELRGEILSCNQSHIIATFHPNYLLRNPSAKKDAFEDFKKIKVFLEQC